ncbi:acetyltransferase, N-acetylglutamate synthase [Mycobacterium sp. JS623]|nr:acetyltransferase, N-acetylglutamate synthase [Mycobacterium sp. JS623]
MLSAPVHPRRRLVDQTSIRRATAADLPAIHQLITDAYTKYIQRIGRPPAPMTADYAAALTHSRVWVLLGDETVVGALVTEDRDDHLLLETVAVAPTVQGSGSGALLLDRAECDAVELGLPEVRSCRRLAAGNQSTGRRFPRGNQAVCRVAPPAIPVPAAPPYRGRPLTDVRVEVAGSDSRRAGKRLAATRTTDPKALQWTALARTAR